MMEPMFCKFLLMETLLTWLYLAKMHKNTMETLGNIPIITRSGNIMSLDQLANIEIVSAARQIRRIGGRQAISIRVDLMKTSH